MFIKKHKADLILIISLLIIAVTLIFVVNCTKKTGAQVDVEIDGKYVTSYSLANDGEWVLNGGTNILVIKDGYAYLSYADCPDHTCVKTGKIKYAGQSIICLPNKVAIIVRAKNSGVDLVS